MTIATLQERIQKAQERIEKKQATIAKKNELIKKKEAKLDTLPDNERIWMESDIKWLNEDIARLRKEIPEIEKTIENYKKQLAGEIEKESILTTEMPESMKRMQVELVERWDADDKGRKEFLRKEYDKLGYREFSRKHGHAGYEMIHKTDEEIRKDNEKAARALIIDLFNRVKAITGEVTDWTGIRSEVGTWGFSVLNGIVVGKQGKCRVESILAGGYNIQRLHVRVLTHEI